MKNSQQKYGNSVSQCRICKKTNHETKDCRFRCKKCEIPNHSQGDFWFQEKKEGDEAKFIKSESDQLFSCMAAEQKSQQDWYIDRGCSNHMTRNQDIFVESDQNFVSHVKLGDGKLQSVEGKRVIVVYTKGGNKKLISDVLYVPNLTQNLLSVGQLLQKGYSVYFEDEKCRIFNKENNLTVAVIKMSNEVFPLSMPLVENVALYGKSLEKNLLYGV